MLNITKEIAYIQMIKELQIIKKAPIISAVALAGWLFGLWITLFTAQQQGISSIKDQVIDAERRAVVAQQMLESLKNRELTEIQGFMDQLVETYDTPAWVKYLDYTDQNFYFLSTNLLYSEIYGTDYLPRGKTDTEIYSKRELSKGEMANILEYAVNDRKAVRAGVGKCIKIHEYAYPLEKNKYDKLWFKKCMLTSGGQTYVLGFQIK